MALTSSQLQTLHDDIDANSGPGGEFEQYVDDLSKEANQAIADAYNTQANPDFWVFKTSVSVDTARKALDWQEILSGSPINDLERWAFDIITANGDFNPTLRNTRDGFSEIFASQANTRTALLDISTELATRGEKLFHVDAAGPGGGDGSAQNSAAARSLDSDGNYIGTVTQIDVANARRL